MKPCTMCQTERDAMVHHKSDKVDFWLCHPCNSGVMEVLELIVIELMEKANDETTTTTTGL